MVAVVICWVVVHIIDLLCRAYIVYFQQTSADDETALSELCKCFRLFSFEKQRARGVHRGLMRWFARFFPCFIWFWGPLSTVHFLVMSAGTCRDVKQDFTGVWDLCWLDDPPDTTYGSQWELQLRFAEWKSNILTTEPQLCLCLFLFYFHFISFQFSFCFINIWIRGYFSGLSWLVGWQKGQLVCKTSDTSSPQWFFFERPLGYVAWLEVISRKIGWLNTNWH